MRPNRKIHYSEIALDSTTKRSSIERTRSKMMIAKIGVVRY